MTARAHIRPLVLRGQACATRTPWLGVVAAAPAAGLTYPQAGGTHETARASSI